MVCEMMPFSQSIFVSWTKCHQMFLFFVFHFGSCLIRVWALEVALVHLELKAKEATIR